MIRIIRVYSSIGVAFCPILKGPQALYISYLNDSLRLIRCQGGFIVGSSGGRFSEFYRWLDLLLHQFFDSFGNLEIPRILVCALCPEVNKKQALFRLIDVSAVNKPVRLLCCGDCKTAIEARDPWIVNNLERIRGLESYSFQPILD